MADIAESPPADNLDFNAAAFAEACVATWPLPGPEKILANILREQAIDDLLAAPRRRVRSFKQRDVARAIRAAKAAGQDVREITPDGRVILGSPVSATPVVDNPWKALRHG